MRPNGRRLIFGRPYRHPAAPQSAGCEIVQNRTLARPTRFEPVAFAFGGQSLSDCAGRRDGNLPFASRLMALLSVTGHWQSRPLWEAKPHFPAVAQTVGCGPGRSKMLYLSMGVD